MKLSRSYHKKLRVCTPQMRGQPARRFHDLHRASTTSVPKIWTSAHVREPCERQARNRNSSADQVAPRIMQLSSTLFVGLEAEIIEDP